MATSLEQRLAQDGHADALAALLDEDPARVQTRIPPYGWTLLHAAAHGGHLATVDLLLRRGLDANAREDGDNTYAMHWAAAEGHLEVVRRLADAGGDVIGAGDDHQLEMIGWAACWEPHADVAAFLVSRGARHHIFSAIALSLEDEVRRLVAEDPNTLHARMSRNEVHQLPLHFAVRMERARMVALLIELGADPLGVDGEGYTAAAYACSPEIDRPVMEALPAEPLAALARHDWERARDVPGALHLMAKRGDESAVAWLLDRGADPSGRWSHWGAEVTPLHLAAMHDHAGTVRLLLEHGADPAVHDSMHDSDPAGWAEFFAHPETAAAIRRWNG